MAAVLASEAGGPVDPLNLAHDLVMSVFGRMSKGERNRVKLRARSAFWLTDGGGPSHRWPAADFEQLEPPRLDLREHAVQRGPVGWRPGQHGVAAAGPSLQVGKRGAIVWPRRPG